MNVFLRELKAHYKGTIIWSLSMLALTIISMAKYETITAQGGAAIQAMLASFPSTVQAVFGMSGLDLTTVGGYFGVCFLLIALTLAVHAGLLGASLIAQEEIDKTAEFLYIKPRSRSRILHEKLLAGIVMLVVVWGAATIGSVVGIQQFAHFGNFTADFWRMMAAAALIQVLFFALGACAATLTRRPRGYGKLISFAIFGSYFLYVFAKISSSFSGAHYLSVFSWFDAVDILDAHALKLHYVIACIALSVVAIVIVYLRYPRRDLTL
jgi:ABC-2 type transport system permease protein